MNTSGGSGSENSRSAEDNEPPYALILSMFKFLEILSESGVTGELAVLVKSAARQGVFIGDRLLSNTGAEVEKRDAEKSDLNMNDESPDTLLEVITSAVSAYELYLHFRPRDRKVTAKLSRAHRKLRMRREQLAKGA